MDRLITINKAVIPQIFMKTCLLFTLHDEIMDFKLCTVMTVTKCYFNVKQ